MEELNRLLARCGDRVRTHVFVFRPSGFAADWARGDLWMSAAAIPGVTVHEDVDGKEAARFGAEESPNACLLCHKDRGVEWLRGAMSKWK